MNYRDPVFRGCTRPPMFLGAPMVPLILVTGLCIMVAMLGLFYNVYVSIMAIAIYLPIYFWMKVITKSDDQRLNQLILRLRLRASMGANRRMWGAVTYTPISYRRR